MSNFGEFVVKTVPELDRSTPRPDAAGDKTLRLPRAVLAGTPGGRTLVRRGPVILHAEAHDVDADVVG
jgi:hypothetical protein